MQLDRNFVCSSTAPEFSLIGCKQSCEYLGKATKSTTGIPHVTDFSEPVPVKSCHHSACVCVFVCV